MGVLASAASAAPESAAVRAAGSAVAALQPLLAPAGNLFCAVATIPGRLAAGISARIPRISAPISSGSWKASAGSASL